MRTVICHHITTTTIIYPYNAIFALLRHFYIIPYIFTPKGYKAKLGAKIIMSRYDCDHINHTKAV